jgi:hypothetical protein
MVEWVEENCLGWKLPREPDTMPMYKHMALFYPEEHAYTFDSYRWVVGGGGGCLAEREGVLLGSCPVHAHGAVLSRGAWLHL